MLRVQGLVVVSTMVGVSLALPGSGEELLIRRSADGVHIVSRAPSAPRPKAPRSSRGQVDRLIHYYANQKGLDPNLVRAVIQVESAFDPGARSRKGAMGLMQLMPETALELGVEDAWDPAQNIRGGTSYLRRMLDRFDGRLELALASYNAGPSVVEKYGGVPPFPETESYVERVLRHYGRPASGSGSQSWRPTRAVSVRRDPVRGIVLFTQP